MTAVLPALHVPPVTLPAERTIPDLRRVIEDAILNDPRTLQTALGPSELGNPCDRCLIHMLAGHAERDGQPVPWLPTLGRAFHDWAEAVVIAHLMASGTDRYLPEGKVAVGQLRGVDITGHSDLYDTHTGTVVDYKLTGKTTLDKVRRAGGPGDTYRRQAHLYGRGWALAGYDVRSVAVWFLPRNAISIDAGQVWQEPYDEQVALDALERANRLAGFIATFGADTVLASATPHLGTEFSCGRYDATPKADHQLDGLIPPQTPDPTPGAGSTAA